MTPDIQLDIRLFGAFRKFHAQPITLHVARGCTVAHVKAVLGAELQRLNSAFQDQELLAKSALASDSRVLDQQACLTESAHLAILPPVCGG
jgi:molybdopterin converting factor small subunit